MRNLRMKQFFAKVHWKRVLVLSLCFALLAGTTLNASAFHEAKVKNKSFEKDSNGDGIPNAWTGDGLLAKDKRVCNKSKHKKCSFKIVANRNIHVLFQEAKFSSGPAGVTATFSGWVKGKDLAGLGGSWIGINFIKTSGGSEGCATIIADGTFGWTKVEASCAATEPFDSIQITMLTNKDSGKIWFDKVNLKAVAH